MGRGLIYLDTSFVIDLLDPGSPRHFRAAKAYATVIVFASSDLVLLEALVHPLRRGDEGDERLVRDILVRFANLPLDRDVYELAARFRAKERLKTPDAIHLACASRHGCSEIWTYDERILSVEVGPIKRAP